MKKEQTKSRSDRRVGCACLFGLLPQSDDGPWFCEVSKSTGEIMISDSQTEGFRNWRRSGLYPTDDKVKIDDLKRVGVDHVYVHSI